jgi:protein TonB
LTPLLKSCSTSVLVHAGILAALYAIPLRSTQTFRSSGQRQVIVLEMRIPTEASAPSAMPMSVSETEPLEPRREPTEMTTAEPRQRAFSSERETRLFPEATELAFAKDQPALPAPSRAAEHPPNPRPPLQQSQPTVNIETPSTAASRPRPTSTWSSIPVEQRVGTDDDREADLSDNPPPRYPSEGIRRRLEGTVTLELRISSAGRVSEVKVLRSSGHTVLDEAAVKAVRQWSGQPARRFGQPISTVERLPIRFRL